jgi:hypothetical protein
MKIQTETDFQLIEMCNRQDCRIFSYDTFPPHYSCSTQDCDKEKQRTIKVLKSKKPQDEEKKYIFAGPDFTHN